MLGERIGNEDRVKVDPAMQAMMKMEKLDIAALKAAFDGA